MDRLTLTNMIVQAALPLAGKDGWSETTLARAAENAGQDATVIRRLFPGGVSDALAHFTLMADTFMAHAYKDRVETYAKEGKQLKIREKITLLIFLRLETYAPHKEAVRYAVAYYSLPHAMHHGVKTLHRTTDLMWKLAGDKATDFNWYTKRLTLAGVYSSTLLHWLDDTSDNHTATWEFLDRRIGNVMQFEKFKAKARDCVNPMSWFPWFQPSPASKTSAS